jgi:hypothetical protein
MRFYLKTTDGNLDHDVYGREILDWLLESGSESEDWSIGRETELIHTPIFIDIFDEELKSIFVLKFVNRTMPKPDTHPIYKKDFWLNRLLYQFAATVMLLFGFFRGKIL